MSDLLSQAPGPLLCGIASGLLAAAFARVTPLARPTDGRRGMERDRALKASSLFAFVEPQMRRVATVSRRLLQRDRAERLERLLDASGCWLGLGALDLVGLGVISACVGSLLGMLLGGLNGSPTLWSPVGAAFGAVAPLLRLSNATLQRNRIMARELPAAIDLAALCMAAGMDFPASLHQVVQQHRGGPSPLQDELTHVLRGLQMGQTRAEVLQRFAELAPIASVREFVSAVVQAERRGTPLRQVLQIQASTLRMRRSVAAEEAAARAGVLLIIPLLLLLASLLIVLIGPFLVNGFGL